MKNNNYKNLLKHYFWGNFDTGVMFIFLSLYIWDKTKNMITVSIAFIIPIIIDTIIDYLFSRLSDNNSRIRLIITGNIGSAIFLSLYGIINNIYILYSVIFLKSLFAKLYGSSLQPYVRETIKENDYKDFISKRNMKSSMGASVGGFILILIYTHTNNIPLLFIISGLIELYSTFYLLKLDKAKAKIKKINEDSVDLAWIKYITTIYTVESFAIASIMSRVTIYVYEFLGVPIQNIGLIFFMVYGISNIIASKAYKFFEKIPLKKMFIISLGSQAILLTLFTNINQIYIIVLAWFLYELISNITNIYSQDRLNRSLFTNIGRRFIND